MLFLSYLNVRKSSIFNYKKFSPVDLTVFVSYFLFSLLLFLSLIGSFNKGFIAFGLSAGFLFFWSLFWKRIEWKKHYLYFFIFIPLLLAGILLIKGYFAGMGINSYLPWAREIVLQGKMPDFLSNISMGLASRMPLVPIFYAGIFSILGFAGWVIAVFPFFFASFSAFLIYLWLSEKAIAKGYVIFGILLLLTNSIFLEVGYHPLQEPFILFFFTAFFYYWEKYRKENDPLYFLLLFLSAVLAAVSKETGLILFLPIGWLFIRDKLYRKRPYCCFLLLVLPLFLWLLRNYIIFDNPLIPQLNGIFKGRYYDLTLAVNRLANPVHLFAGGNILAKIAQTSYSLIFSFFPLIALSFYGFWKKGKAQYILLFFLLLLTVLFLEPNVSDGFVRYFAPFLAIFVVYAIVGLQELKSRIFLSLVFFLNLWGLFSAELFFSQSKLFAPIEKIFHNFGSLFQFIHGHSLIAALIIGVFFFFLISPHKRQPGYLILLSGCAYLVNAEVFHLGSWLNTWLPILGIIFITLTWRLIIKLKESIFLGLISGCIIILLIVNGWGLAAAYSLAHGSFIFPNYAEAYEFRPEMADRIETIEGGNKDFYILADNPAYFAWYRNFKIIQPASYTFNIITNLEYKNSASSLEIYDLFKISKIKYVLKSGRYDFQLQSDNFYDKIKNNPDLFKLIFQKSGIYLWRVE